MSYYVLKIFSGYFVMAKKKIDNNEMLGLFCISDGCSENMGVVSVQAYDYLQQGIHKLEEGLYLENQTSL